MAVEPVVREAVASGVGSDAASESGTSSTATIGDATNGVAYCVVHYDAPDIMAAGLGAQYMITTVPTLLSFDAGEAQIATKATDPERMVDRRWLDEWIWTEARRRGGRGGGGGGWFGLWR